MSMQQRSADFHIRIVANVYPSQHPCPTCSESPTVDTRSRDPGQPDWSRIYFRLVTKHYNSMDDNIITAQSNGKLSMEKHECTPTAKMCN